VSKVGKKVSASKGTKRTAGYVLSANGVIYQLYGHESELKRLRGKRARITGNVVGNEITVNSVAPAAE
jgi:hypothetical protein